MKDPAEFIVQVGSMVDRPSWCPFRTDCEYLGSAKGSCVGRMDDEDGEGRDNVFCNRPGNTKEVYSIANTDEEIHVIRTLLLLVKTHPRKTT